VELVVAALCDGGRGGEPMAMAAAVMSAVRFMIVPQCDPSAGNSAVPAGKRITGSCSELMRDGGVETHPVRQAPVFARK
jgi:hypothetical protein